MCIHRFRAIRKWDVPVLLAGPKVGSKPPARLQMWCDGFKGHPSQQCDHRATRAVVPRLTTNPLIGGQCSVSRIGKHAHGIFHMLATPAYVHVHLCIRMYACVCGWSTKPTKSSYARHRWSRISPKMTKSRCHCWRIAGSYRWRS